MNAIFDFLFPPPQSQLSVILESIPLPVVVGSVAGLIFIAWKVCLPMFGGKEGQPLNKKEFQKYRLIQKQVLTHNTRRFRFALATPTTKLGLPVGAHIGVRVPNPPAGVEDIERFYTPTSSDDDTGYFDLVIKVYPDGNLTPRLDKLAIGDYILARGPHGTIRYPEPGLVQKVYGKKKTDYPCKQINFICGGTGVTPILQVATQILKDNKGIKVAIINGNVSVDDMLCHDLLETMKDQASRKGHEFSVFYTLDKPPQGWNGGSGYVTADMIANNLFPAGSDTVTMLCGPPPMVRGCKRTLESLGFTKDRIFSF